MNHRVLSLLLQLSVFYSFWLPIFLDPFSDTATTRSTLENPSWGIRLNPVTIFWAHDESCSPPKFISSPATCASARQKANSRCLWGKFLILDLDHNSIHSCEFLKIMLIKKKNSFLLLTQFGWTEIHGWLLLPSCSCSCFNLSFLVEHTSIVRLFEFSKNRRAPVSEVFQREYSENHRDPVIWIFNEPQRSGYLNISYNRRLFDF